MKNLYLPAPSLPASPLRLCLNYEFGGLGYPHITEVNCGKSILGKVTLVFVQARL